jgi:hypothetical protein
LGRDPDRVRLVQKSLSPKLRKGHSTSKLPDRVNLILAIPVILVQPLRGRLGQIAGPHNSLKQFAALRERTERGRYSAWRLLYPANGSLPAEESQPSIGCEGVAVEFDSSPRVLTNCLHPMRHKTKAPRLLEGIGRCLGENTTR